VEVKDSIEIVPGFRVGAVDAGLRKQPAADLTLIVADGPCSAAGVFTTNQVKAAPVLYDQACLEANPDQIQAVIINAAVANACTGDEGMRNAKQTADWVAESIGCKPDQVLVMSTGVIGVQLPMSKFQSGIPAAKAALRPDGWSDAACAIMTTDTKPKISSLTADGITIAGIAKGAGMIAPNMATMLSAIVTDADIAPQDLHSALRRAAGVSFNHIVIDGDMSTNDTVLLLASGASGKRIKADNLNHFTEMLTKVCADLAKKIVKDGEGASRFIQIIVTGATHDWVAKEIANTIATSPLVKTAFYGGDANWGRILAAAGRASISDHKLDQNTLSLWYDDLQLVEKGMPLNYDDKRANAIASQPEITVTLDLGQGGREEYTVWTCDLSHDYVSINGHYRT